MKNNVKLFVPVLLAFLIGTMTFAFAQTNGGGKSRPGGGDAARGGDGFHFGGLPPHILAQLNLTAAQAEQITALQTAAQTASATYVETIRAAGEQLRTLRESGTFDEAQARAILATRAQASIELDIVRLRTDAAIFNLLTAEQRTLLAELRQRHGGSPRGRRHDAPSQN